MINKHTQSEEKFSLPQALEAWKNESTFRECQAIYYDCYLGQKGGPSEIEIGKQVEAWRSRACVCPCLELHINT